MKTELQDANDEGASLLLSSLRGLIREARQRVVRAVDAVQVQTCWEIGLHIVEFEQGGSAQAEYGTRLLQILASALAAEFGKGFDASNLRYMRLFYQAFPIGDALRHELSWTHYRICQKELELRQPVSASITAPLSDRRLLFSGVSRCSRCAHPPVA